MKEKTKFLPAIIMFAAIVLITTAPVQSKAQEAKAPETAETTETYVPEVSPLLKNIVYVRVMTRYNGVDYYTGVVNPRDTVIKEYNLGNVAVRLKEDGIPISNDNVKSLYTRIRNRLMKSGLRVLDIQQEDMKQATLVPNLNLAIDAIATSNKNYVMLVNLSLSKWISTWAGTDNLQAQVIVWWHKVLLTTDQEQLISSLEEAADEVTDEFLKQLAAANPKPEPTETTETSGDTKH